MRLPTKQHTDRGRLDVKMTPMIDVVFLLLIFFVCTASFQIVEEALPSNLSAPGAIPSEDPPEELLDLQEVVIKVLPRSGGGVTWIVGEQPYDDFPQVRSRLQLLAQIDNQLPVILDVDGAVPMGAVVTVWDASRLAGFQTIQFSVSEEAARALGG